MSLLSCVLGVSEAVLACLLHSKGKQVGKMGGRVDRKLKRPENV